LSKSERKIKQYKYVLKAFLKKVQPVLKGDPDILIKTYNPSYVPGEDCCSKPSWAKKVARPYLDN
jgi:hypothetical protein